MTPATRVFEGARTWRLSWERFGEAAALIAEAERLHAPGLVIGVERGGRALATALSAGLGVPAVMIRTRHNASDQMRLPATGQVSIDLSPLADCEAGRVLVADDICGSGATLAAIRQALTTRHHATAVRSAVLCRNAGSAVDPDTWAWDVADWVSFPWEPEPSTPTEPLPALVIVRHP
jgi:hypoxanthine phosphoribosyltransferase